jgi:hypothetical protein
LCFQFFELVLLFLIKLKNLNFIVTYHKIIRLYEKTTYLKMKNLYKIITFFAIIFIAGIYLTVITVNSSLSKFETQKEIFQVQKDTIRVLKTESRTV